MNLPLIRGMTVGVLLGSAAVLTAFAADPTPTPTPCPLSTASTADSTKSPEQQEKKTYVTHNGHVSCVGNSSVPAHASHGDVIGGPCTGGG